MGNYLIRNATIIDPQSPFHQQVLDLHILDGKIENIGQSLSTDGAEIIEGKDLHISPGWLDLHVQSAEPGFEQKESLEALAAAAAMGGFTAILCYPNTHPVADQQAHIAALKSRTSSFPVDFLPAGAISQGANGKQLAELYDMQSAGAVAFTDGSHPLQHSGLMMRALLYTRAFNGLVIQYPTDMHLAENGQMHEGAVSTRLGMKGIPTVAEDMGISRDLHLLNYTQGRMLLHPLTSPKALEMADQGKNASAQLFIGTNLAYLTESDEALTTFDSHYKLLPPLRDADSVNQLKQALANGKIDVLASGHTAQGLEEKKLPVKVADPGMLALQTAFSLAMEKLIDPGLIDLSRWVELVSINPRKILSLSSQIIEKNQPANLTIFQPTEDWILKKETIPSRSKNSPYIGRSLKGRILGIINHKAHLNEH